MLTSTSKARISPFSAQLEGLRRLMKLAFEHLLAPSNATESSWWLTMARKASLFGLTLLITSVILPQGLVLARDETFDDPKQPPSHLALTGIERVLADFQIFSHFLEGLKGFSNGYNAFYIHFYYI